MPYRTVDGGHPAPYPDMTDEQLYNYEVTFNVSRRTFDRPPTPGPVTQNAPLQQTWHGQDEQHQQTGARQEPFIHHRAALETEEMSTVPREERMFDAPRYRARPVQPETSAAPEVDRAPPAALVPAPVPSTVPTRPLDFSRPVRLIITKQPVEIITTRARHPIYKVQGYIGDDDVVTVFTLDGRLSEHGLQYLENVPETERLYLNIYLNQDPGSANRFVVTQHATREAADAEAAAEAGHGRGERLKCIDVEINA